MPMEFIKSTVMKLMLMDTVKSYVTSRQPPMVLLKNTRESDKNYDRITDALAIWGRSNRGAKRGDDAPQVRRLGKRCHRINGRCRKSCAAFLNTDY